MSSNGSMKLLLLNMLFKLVMRRETAQPEMGRLGKVERRVKKRGRRKTWEHRLMPSQVRGQWHTGLGKEREFMCMGNMKYVGGV